MVKLKDIGKKKKEVPPKEENLPIERGFDMIFGHNEADVENSPTQDIILEKALTELFSVEGIDLKSDINNIQISAITRGYIFANVYKCGPMADLVRHILELSVSKNRQGRGEFVKVLQSSNRQEEEAPIKLMRRRLLE